MKKKYICYYSLVFIIFSCVIFFPFVQSGYWMINSKDCIKQHFPAFVYLGQYIRGIIKNLFLMGKLVIPQWDWNLAYGSSVFTTLNYYAFGDPLDLVSVITPTKYAPYMFQALIIFRLYLAGLSFSYFAWKKNENKFSIMIGSLVYIFSAYGIETSTGHVFFANVLIYLPIFLVAVEKLIFEKKSALMIFISFLSCVSNFYFLYMLSIYAGVYFLITFFEKDNNKNKRKMFTDFIREGIRFALSYIAGIGCAAIIFIPVMIAVKNNGRGPGGILNLISYDIRRYVNIFSGSFEYISGSLNGGYASIALVAIIAIFLKYRNNLKFVIGIILFTILECIPAVGWALNGFTYITDRWTFIVTFFIAYVTVLGISNLEKETRNKTFVKIGFCFMLYFLISIVLKKHFQVEGYKSIYISLIIGLVLLELYRSYKNKTSYIFKIFVLGIMLVNIAGGSKIYFEKLYKTNFFMNKKLYNQTLYNSSLSKEYKMKPGEQIDVEGHNILNYSIFNKYGSSSLYWSMFGKEIAEYNDLLLNSDRALCNMISGYDSRTIMNTLNSVKYVIVQNEYYERIPYGYKLQKKKFDKKIYKNKYCLSPAYTYDSYITKKEWKKLSAIDKEDVLLETAVVDKANDIAKKRDKLVFNDKKIQSGQPFLNEIKKVNRDNKDVIINNNSIVVKKARSYVKIPIEGENKAENYICLKNLSYDPINGEKAVDETPMVFWYNNKARYCNYANKYSRYTTDKKDFLVNLGYFKTKGQNVQIEFRVRGIYKFTDFQFISKKLNIYDKNINKLRNNSVKYIRVNGNNVYLQKKSKKPEILCINIPYSDGWTAYVNGKKVNTERVNVMKLGIILKKGNNNIILKYQTPGMKLGLMISIFTILILVFRMIIICKKQKLMSININH